MKRILVTGATGKVGSSFINRVLGAIGGSNVTIRALCHNRPLEPRPRLEIVRGSMSDREAVRQAMQGVTHVVHCATCKETPDEVMDVTVKGLFWVLEECRASPSFRQIILIGGDAALGERHIALRKVHQGGVGVVHIEGTARAAFFPIGAEHKVVKDQLAAAIEQAGEASLFP